MLSAHQSLEYSRSVYAALQIKYILAALFVTSTLFVHYRGRVRYNFTRQLTDHSTFVAPYNVFIYLLSRVSNRPFLNPRDFPELKFLTENWETIREEGLRLLDEGYVRAATTHNDLGFHSFFRHGWKRFYLKWYGDPLPSAERLCPRTAEFLSRVPLVHGAMFAMLPSGAHLGRHRDPFAGSVRYHLGLRTPNSDKCWIEVDGTRYSWRDGEAVLFDETYIHEARNETSIDRLILFCDVERPLRGWLPKAINRFVIDHVVKLTATQNTQGDPIGFANRVFGQVYRVRLLFKKFKKWNPRLYYTMKYFLIVIILKH